MIFGPTPLEEAKGAILAHSLRLTGKVLKKGTVLDDEAIAAELDYTHAGGKFARGLQFRSERRAKIFMKGRYGNPRQNDDPYST